MDLRVKTRPEDFIVREALRQEPGTAGDYAVYRVQKRLVTTMEVQERLANELHVPPAALSFPALKDKGAQATQYFTLRGRAANSITGQGYTAQFVGRMARPLGPLDLAGNWFTITLRDIAPSDADALLRRLPSLEQSGLPNYFDEQRFGSVGLGGELTTEFTEGTEENGSNNEDRDATVPVPSLGSGLASVSPVSSVVKSRFIGKAILLGDAEAALRLYLTDALPADPPELRAFKRSAGARWGDWAALFVDAPRSNQRSVLGFLKDHPKDFRKAVNLITPRLLPLLLQAYQSFLWNRIASRYLEKVLGVRGQGLGGEGAAPSPLIPTLIPNPLPLIPIAGEELAVYREMPEGLVARLRGMSIPLPQNKADYADPVVADIAQGVLAEEGLTLERVKARILTRAYLPKNSRPVLVLPQGVKGRTYGREWGDWAGRLSCHYPEKVRTPKEAIALTFFLPPGAYATLVVKVLAATA